MHIIDKFKDLPPEVCSVNWKSVDGWVPPNEPWRVPPKIKIYDGFKQFHYGRTLGESGAGGTGSWPIPVDNTLWYPLMMENGDFYGRKLLRPAFPAWFFSNLMHLFSNRYYERFGEPTPSGFSFPERMWGCAWINEPNTTSTCPVITSSMAGAPPG